MHMKLCYIPNVLTCLRFLLIGPVLWALLSGHYLLALSVFIIAGLTDALDGLLARLNGWTSRFGAIADPLADKLLLMSSFITLSYLGLIPLWLMIVIVGRDLWILGGVICYRCLVGEFKVVPSQISKINTFLQIILVPILLVNLSLISLPKVFIQFCIFAVLITSIASFLHYTWIFGRRAFCSEIPENKKLSVPREVL